MENTMGRGALPSPFDYRDAIAASSAVAAAAALTLPPTFHTDVGPVLMQAGQPSCVSHMAAELLSLYYFKKTGAWISFSPRFLDILAKRYDGQDRATGGTYPRLVMSLMVNFGCATTDVLPNDVSLSVLDYRDDDALTTEVFADAAKYKTPGYTYVPPDMQNTRGSIFLYGAIGACLYIDSNWWESPAGVTSWADKDIDPLRTPNVNKSLDDGHAITPCGWNDVTINELRNHWSITWANKGEAAYDANKWRPFVMEQWAIAEIPTDVQDFINNLPSPTSFHYAWNSNLSYGQFSDDIKEAQIALMILGHLDSSTFVAADLGNYGPKTSVAVGKFQIANRITPSPNNIGPLTRASLNKIFDASVKI